MRPLVTPSVVGPIVATLKAGASAMMNSLLPSYQPGNRSLATPQRVRGLDSNQTPNSRDLRRFMGMDPQRPLYLDLSETAFDVRARQVTMQPGHSIRGPGLLPDACLTQRD
jgi:hypothetical protein